MPRSRQVEVVAVRRLRALYLTDRFDGPFRYRCVHACEQLRASGAIANLLHLDDPAVLTELERYSVVVLFRLAWSPRLKLVVEGAQSAGIPIVLDLDDLVFDPACAELMPFRRRYGDAHWRDTYGQQIAGLRRTFEACDLLVGSTPALVAHAERLGKPGRVHRNVVPDRYLALGKRIERVRPMLRRAPTLGYFSGSDTHDEDFASIASSIRSVLERQPGARLVVCGHIQLREVLRGLESRIVRLPYLSWRVYPWAIGACHVNLAPLALRNAFTDAKSALKFFEAGALGVPTVATPTAELANAIENGVSGWLPGDEREWTDVVLEALRDEVSLRVGAAARRAVLREHSADSQRGRLEAILRSVAIEAHGTEPEARRIDFDEHGRAGGLTRPRAATRRGAELAKVFQALGARRAAGIDPNALERWLDAKLADAVDPYADGARLLVGDLDAAGWQPNAELAGGGRLPGERMAIGSDPSWSSPVLTLESAGARYLAVRMRAETPEGRAEAKLYWLAGRETTLSERCAVAIPLVADGVDRTYLVDLQRSEAGASWKRARGALSLRFDPLDRKGSLRVSGLALLAEAWQPPDLVALRAPPALELPAKKRAERGALKKALQRIRTGERLRITSARAPDELRAALARSARGSPIVVERIETIAGGSAQAVLLGAKPAAAQAVDIVVPVYNARKETLRCAESVLRHACGDFRVVVIDDASTDPELWPALTKLARKSERVVLLKNERNLGFVGTVNRGIDHAAGRDVLVLNSDTKVFARFLEGIAAAAHADPRTGIVCPLSNNATICSVPEFCRPNPLPDGLSGKKMAALIRRSSLRRRPELVTPVGFCMYLRADMLADVGKLDPDFGRGFGEENDLGERAKARRWSIRLADDVYVWHDGKASFGDEGWALEARNSGVLAAKYPSYATAVSHFVRTNPLADIHADLALHLKRKSHATEPSVLELLQASPFVAERGGIEHIVRDLVAGLGLPRVVLAYPAAGGIEVAEVIGGELADPLRYFFALEHAVPRFAHEHAEAEAVLARILTLFQVGAVHIHHLLHWPLAIERTLRCAKVPYVVTVHDHYPVCTSVNLLDVRDWSRCCPASIGNDERTRACQRALCAALGETAPADPARFLRQHRALHSALLAGARRVVFPSPSAASVSESLHALRKKQRAVVPHGYDPPPRRAAPAAAGGPLRVALLGEVTYPSKGAEGYLAVLRACRASDIEFHVFGRTDRFGFDEKISDTGARVVRHGGYQREQITELLTAARIDVGLLLSISPETFSLTLSELLGAGVPVVATRQGAFVDRLAGTSCGILVDDPARAATVLLELVSGRDRLEQLTRTARSYRHPTLADFCAAHRDMYRECLERAPAAARQKRRVRELRELGAARRPGLPSEASVATTKPELRHTKSWWYPWAERLKPHVPESLRAIVRRRLAGDGLVPLARFRLPGPAARIGSELSVVRRYVRTTLLESLGADPYLSIEHEPIATSLVRAVRFNLWCSHPHAGFAQLYWKHGGDTAFAEERSIVVPLDTRAAAWQEYVVRLDALSERHAWYAGGEIVALRFDPIDFQGLVGLGELVLCGSHQALAAPTARS